MENGFYGVWKDDKGTKTLFADENVLADEDTKRLFEKRDQELKAQREAEAKQSAHSQAPRKDVPVDAPWKRMYPGENEGLWPCAGRVLLYGAIGVAAFLSQQIAQLDLALTLAMAVLAGYQLGKLVTSRR